MFATTCTECIHTNTQVHEHVSMIFTGSMLEQRGIPYDNIWSHHQPDVQRCLQVWICMYTTMYSLRFQYTLDCNEQNEKFYIRLNIISVKSYLYCKIPRLYSLSGRTSYHKMSWSLEAARLNFIMIVLFWNLTVTSAAALPRCLSNFKAIGKV